MNTSNLGIGIGPASPSSCTCCCSSSFSSCCCCCLAFDLDISMCVLCCLNLKEMGQTLSFRGSVMKAKKKNFSEKKSRKVQVVVSVSVFNKWRKQELVFMKFKH